MPSDRGDLALLWRHQRRHQRRGGIEALALPQKRTECRALLSPAHECLERMLVGIEGGECVDAEQGRKQQRLQAATPWLFPVMS